MKFRSFQDLCVFYSEEISPLSKQSTFSFTNTLIFLWVTWGLISLLVFLFFSVPIPPPGEDRSPAYLNTITVLETGAFVFSSLACFRNWKSSQIISGRNVWLWIGLGLLSYSGGNIFFYLWNNVFELDPSVSFGDFFYLLSYVFLANGMLQAVLNRRLNLEFGQWAIVLIIGILGILLAAFPIFQGGSELAVRQSPTGLSRLIALEAPAIAQAPPAETVPEAAPETAPEAVPETAPEVAPETAPEVAPEVAPADETISATAPAWAVSVDNFLDPFAFWVTILYVLGDCLLLVVATILLVAFWGGRFSQSWKLIAIAAFCLYIADIYFAYQDYYQEGGLWEVFWTFSAIFFGLGAIVEHAISSRSRRTSRRRRA